MSDSPGWMTYESPIGPLTLVTGPQGIASIHFPGTSPKLSPVDQRPFVEATRQLDGYFAGQRRSFELDLDLRGNPLQLAVWRQLLEIPWGRTATYGQIAARIDEALYEPDLEPYKRARVVGAAIGSNPVPVVVPCHRVIGADGSLTGYFGGLERKRTLLELEGWEQGRPAERGRSSAQLEIL